MSTKKEKIHGQIKKVIIPLIFTLIFCCLFFSFASRFSDFLFYSISKRFLIISIFLIIDISITYFIWHSIKKRNLQQKLVLNKKNLALFFVNLILALIILASGIIPKPAIPANHHLEIFALPSLNSTNTVYIRKIIKNINAPNVENAEVKLDQLKFEGGNFTQSIDGFQIEENTRLSCSSFFSGCMTILLTTSPESGKILVRFDDIEEIYSLNSQERAPTEVSICSPLSMNKIPLKWQLIVLILYISDFISLLVIVSMIAYLNYLLWFDKKDQTRKILRKILFDISIGTMIMAAVFQICRIVFSPSEIISNAPPAKPSSFSGELTFETIYKECLHTRKFAHSFVLLFMDIYPKLDTVYISEQTLDNHNFNSSIFAQWFSVYNPQPEENMPVNLDNTEIDRIINSHVWLSKEITLSNEDTLITFNYLTIAPQEYILIVGQDFTFYLLPDIMLKEYSRISE